ncbi:sensor histidine kinase [Oleisolibacter albus]|uniref:sensor histidine kinase n=1 Tax=Oleisolibacter albus TaxID=2171757 RepID=UPI000DF3BDF4|nr:HAMP domain-containing sensor histidine kinase [Oleisolibacter albus]
MALSLPPFVRSLSSRLLLLTMVFVLLAEVFIYVPSAARFRLEWLNGRLAAGHLAALSVRAAPEGMVTRELEAELLRHVGAYAVDARVTDMRVLMLMAPDTPAPAERYDLAGASPWVLIRDALLLLPRQENRVIGVAGPSPKDAGVRVMLLIDEAPLRAALLDYSGRIVLLSIVISVITAGLVYLALLVMTVRPMRRLVEAMMAFKRDPESTGPALTLATDRDDEVGIAQRELIALQAAVRQALRQRQRLAALGTAVAKINHDIRGVLASATLLSERLLSSPDPDVQRTSGRILEALERAALLCGQTLDYSRDGLLPLRKAPVDLHALIDAVGESLRPGAGLVWDNAVPAGTTLLADREQLFRVLANLGRNAVEAGAARITLSARSSPGRLELLVSDDGPGLAPRARENLFVPFAASTRANGSGLGLPIAQEILRAHGGDLRLLDSSGSGTVFALGFPAQGMRK